MDKLPAEMTLQEVNDTLKAAITESSLAMTEAAIAENAVEVRCQELKHARAERTLGNLYTVFNWLSESKRG